MRISACSSDVFSSDLKYVCAKATNLYSHGLIAWDRLAHTCSLLLLHSSQGLRVSELLPNHLCECTLFCGCRTLERSPALQRLNKRLHNSELNRHKTLRYPRSR